jgi:hypothetical protein
VTSCLFSKKPTDSPQYAVLFGIIRVVFAGNLEHCRKGSGIGIDSMAYSVGDLIGSQYMHKELWKALEHTCWLMSTMPMSFLSSVNLSNADSIEAVSVLLSTTRKFFWASAPAVTCYPHLVSVVSRASSTARNTYANTSKEKACHRVLDLRSVILSGAKPKYGRTSSPHHR